MDDKPPPRKQLRLLAKGRSKIGELVRRKRNKSAKTVDRGRHNDDTDVDDNVPFLSRIADPSQTSKPSLKITLKIDPDRYRNHLMFLQTLKGSPTQPSSTPIGGKDDIDTEVDRSSIKSERRKGIVSIDSLTKNSQPQFSTQAVMAGRKAVATQHTVDEAIAKFTFTCDGPSAGKTPSTTPQSASTQSSQGVSDAESESGIKVPSMNEDTQIMPKKENGKQNLPQRRPSRLFEKYRITFNKEDLKPASHEFNPVSRISDFVRPQVATPELGPTVNRSVQHKPWITPKSLKQSVPDNIESSQFIEDVEVDLPLPKKSQGPHAPAFDKEKRAERVPIGMRMGSLTAKVPLDVFPGRPILKYPHPTITGPSELRQSSVEVPENLYTEPNRLSSAYLASRSNLKRKRLTSATLPPPSFTHQHTSSPSFNVFSSGVLLYPELCLLLAANLPVQTLINLYSISKDFHIILNQRFTTVILNQVIRKAPAASRCYPWRSFAHLCQPDPAHKAGANRLNSDLTLSNCGTTISIPPPPPSTHDATALPGLHSHHTIRNHHLKIPPSKKRVPTFRWLHMAIHRQKTIHELYYLFAARGVPLPGSPDTLTSNPSSFALTLHKLWFAFDIPDNGRRIAYFSSPHLITPTDLSNILIFLVKLDMLCNSPVDGEKRDSLRKIFMSSVNGFDTLRAALKGEIFTDELEVLRAWTRYNFQLDREDITGVERPVGGGWVPLGLSEEDHAASDMVFGIPRDEVGLLKKEFWGAFDYDPVKKMRVYGGAPMPGVGRRTMSLMRPDQIVIRETVRRGWKMGRQFLKALLVGYMDEETLGPMGPRDLNGGRHEVLEDEGEYGADDLVGGLRALKVEDGGDDLLDLGDTCEGSVLTVKEVGPRKQAVQKRKEEDERLKGFMKECEEEIEMEEQLRMYKGFTYVDG